MSKKNLVRLVVLPLAMAAFFVLADKPATAAAPNSIAVGVETFSVPDGGDYFALSMKPEGVAPAAWKEIIPPTSVPSGSSLWP